MIYLFAALITTTANAAERQFLIGTTAFAESDIIDARALPDLSGQATILITFSTAAAKRLETLTAAHIGKPIEIMLDGTVLITPIVREPIAGGTVQISGTLTFEAAAKLAKSISGKDPLPDDLQE